jgi:hypothetical protein
MVREFGLAGSMCTGTVVPGWTEGMESREIICRCVMAYGAPPGTVTDPGGYASRREASAIPRFAAAR